MRTGLVQLFEKWWCNKLKMWTKNLDAIFVQRKIAWHLKQCQNRWNTNKLSSERQMFDELHHLDYLKLFELNFRLSFSILRCHIWLIAFWMHFCFHFILYFEWIYFGIASKITCWLIVIQFKVSNHILNDVNNKFLEPLKTSLI